MVSVIYKKRDLSSFCSKVVVGSVSITDTDKTSTLSEKNHITLSIVIQIFVFIKLGMHTEGIQPSGKEQIGSVREGFLSGAHYV